MSSLVPRSAYTQQELDQLYPSHLELRQVQVILRHGERSPTQARFQKAGLAAYWPYCDAAKRFSSAVMETTDWSKWGTLPYKRRLEVFGVNDLPIVAEGPGGEKDTVCQLGELTDKGRETTLALGERLRRLYVDQLHFLPDVLSHSRSFYIRASAMPRALESAQQVFTGLYPTTKRDPSMPPPFIYTRSFTDETLFPNEWNCKRLAELSAAFGDRCAQRWNDSKEIAFLNKRIGKWMPDATPKVAVDGHPRISGIMDTVNATLAHGPATRLPSEFYDPKVLEILNRIAVEEWFAGYEESNEYRTLGIGGLVGDIVTRMVAHANHISGSNTSALTQVDHGGEQIQFALSGAHDTSLAGILAGLGAFDEQKWPYFTSHLAIELFQGKMPVPSNRPIPQSLNQEKPAQPSTSWWATMFGSNKASANTADNTSKLPATRKPTKVISEEERHKLKDYYVRIRYNDRPVTLPGCRAPGKHLDGDESFCTLEAFKAIADKITPKNWKEECKANLGAAKFPQQIEKAGSE